MYPTGYGAPKFYGLLKIHKQGTPLRPILSSCGLVTYGVAKELTKILKPLVGKSPHHINSTQDFVEQIKDKTLLSRECLSSYDVSVLFTSVPVYQALGIIKDLLEKDPTLKKRAIMSVGDIVLLLEFCLKDTYFSFQDQFYEQDEGVAMGLPVNPTVANLYMEDFEQKALNTVSQCLGYGTSMWMTPDMLIVDILIPTPVNVHHSLGVPHILRAILVLVTLAVYLTFGSEFTQTNDLVLRHTLLYFYDCGSTYICVYKYLLSFLPYFSITLVFLYLST